MKAFDDEETRQNAPQNNEKQDEAESDEQETGSQAQTEQIERTGGITKTLSRQECSSFQ